MVVKGIIEDYQIARETAHRKIVLNTLLDVTNKVRASEVTKIQSTLPEKIVSTYLHVFNSHSHLTPLFQMSYIMKVRN